MRIKLHYRWWKFDSTTCTHDHCSLKCKTDICYKQHKLNLQTLSIRMHAERETPYEEKRIPFQRTKLIRIDHTYLINIQKLTFCWHCIWLTLSTLSLLTYHKFCQIIQVVYNTYKQGKKERKQSTDETTIIIRQVHQFIDIYSLKDIESVMHMVDHVAAILLMMQLNWLKNTIKWINLSKYGRENNG